MKLLCLSPYTVCACLYNPRILLIHARVGSSWPVYFCLREQSYCDFCVYLSFTVKKDVSTLPVAKPEESASTVYRNKDLALSGSVRAMISASAAGELCFVTLFQTFTLVGAESYQAVWGVMHALHTPLVSVMNTAVRHGSGSSVQRFDPRICRSSRGRSLRADRSALICPRRNQARVANGEAEWKVNCVTKRSQIQAVSSSGRGATRTDGS